jgi:NDP-sugar pyrophosphorylase family protein
MKAMILAAGLGTRLMPLTRNTPKALVRINGIPLLELALKKLVREGFDEIIVNVHHFAGEVINYLSEAEIGEAIIGISDESGQLLDTGGGILNASWFLEGDEPFLVYNVDVVSDIDLGRMFARHRQTAALATLAVRSRPSGRYLLFDGHHRLCGWEDAQNQQIRWAGQPAGGFQRMAFSGIHVISPEIFPLFTESGTFSIIETYLRLAGEHLIAGFYHTDDSAWFDAGKPDQLERISEFLSHHPEYLAL